MGLTQSHPKLHDTGTAHPYSLQPWLGCLCACTDRQMAFYYQAALNQTSLMFKV